MSKISDYWPLQTKLDYVLGTGFAIATLAPYAGLLPAGFRRVESLGLLNADGLTFSTLNLGCAGLALTLSPFAVARGYDLFAPKKISGQPTIDICGMPCREDALFTGVLILGSTGSGKTSSAILPPLDAIFQRYNHPDSDTDDILQKIGGFSLDAKMEFNEPILYFMHAAGRNVLEEAVMIRPNCFIPIGVFEDPDTGFLFFLQGQSFSINSEVSLLLQSDARVRELEIPVDFLSKRPGDRIIAEEKLRNLVFDVGNLDLNYLGWRSSGGELVRLKSISAIGKFETDESVRIQRPRKLIYKEMSGVDTGIRYNIVDNRVSPSIAGQRLADIAALVDGGEGGKKDPYWDKQAANLFTMVLDAWQTLDSNQDIGGPDILRFVEQVDKQEELISKIKARRDAFGRAAIAHAGRNRMLEREAKARHRKCDDLINFFEVTWRNMAPNTKTIIESCVRNMFGPFAVDANLAESFCSPATIFLEEMISKGKFFFFVAGNDYKSLAKVLGTAIKLDAHKQVLDRMTRADLNQTRRLLEVIDECQTYAVAGKGGDQYTKSMSRSSKFMHINASQSEASIEEEVGHSRYGTYIQAYGVRVWYNLLDSKSRREASDFSGQVYRERREIQNGGLTYENVLGLKGGKEMTEHTRYEKESRFGPHFFLELDTHESVIYNKDRRRLLGENKIHRQPNKPHSIGRGDGLKKKERFVRDYASAYPEYCAQNRRFNPEGLAIFWHDPTASTSSAIGPAIDATTPSGEALEDTNDQDTAGSSVAPTRPPAGASKADFTTAFQNTLVAAKSETPSAEERAEAPVLKQTLSSPKDEVLSNKGGPLSRSDGKPAEVVRDPNEETKKRRFKKSKPVGDPPASLLTLEADQRSEGNKTVADSGLTDSEVTRSAAIERMRQGTATPLDLDLINSTCCQPAVRAALAELYIREADVGSLIQTQKLAAMAERGTDGLHVHRGPEGLSQGTPKGRGTLPTGTEALAKSKISQDSLDLSSVAKSAAEALMASARSAEKRNEEPTTARSLEELRKLYGDLP